MINKEHAIIRTSDLFDAKHLLRFYASENMYGALLDGKREPILPNQSELEELLQNKDATQSFYAVEDKEGNLHGFIVLKGINQEALFGEIILLFDNQTYLTNSPLIHDALEFIENKAFRQLHLKKLVTTCIDEEEPLKNFLQQHLYILAGIMREVLFARGKWHNLETWVKLSSTTN
ncbi:MAG TPA: GNAT family protein [Candidatus Hydrogenedens sp.]|nr:GNAT family N-acetyltransferase [Candidatus Hydrogenedens sp.]HOK09467.1 GNAT family protein [Candidatus Hydrogenedens sp.]HOL18942.1 GNAT family protein [Candidatus Hydrogenedens sp.]HPP59006.1 GNAT family protein [Candidatus Hydrogenedens sp.]